jgi:23S rRNA (uridine2552-2'-O)-methyltransferase
VGRNRPANPYKRPDRFAKKAQGEGYAARSVYKLEEIVRRTRVLRRGDKVVDLGCSPGSWMAFAADAVGPSGRVLGVDIEEPKVHLGPVIVRSVLDVTADEIRDALGGPANAVLSDMAPRTTGDTFGDHVRQIELARAAHQLARELLAPGGSFVCKVFDGEEAHAFVQEVRTVFEETRRVRPEAVRTNSREFYVVGLGRVISATTDPG